MKEALLASNAEDKQTSKRQQPNASYDLWGTDPHQKSKFPFILLIHHIRLTVIALSFLSSLQFLMEMMKQKSG